MRTSSRREHQAHRFYPATAPAERAAGPALRPQSAAAGSPSALPSTLDAHRPRGGVPSERDELQTEPAAASIALQQQRIHSFVDDWQVMTEDDKQEVLRLIFAEVSADHSGKEMIVKLKPRATWEPYVEAILARQRWAGGGMPPVTSSERKTGVYGAHVITTELARDERGWLWLAGDGTGREHESDGGGSLARGRVAQGRTSAAPHVSATPRRRGYRRARTARGLSVAPFGSVSSVSRANSRSTSTTAAESPCS